MPTGLVIPIRGVVIPPGAILPIPVGRPASVKTLETHLRTGDALYVVSQIDPTEDEPTMAQLSTAGTEVTVLQIARLPDGTMRALLEGLVGQARVSDLVSTDGVLTAEFEDIDDAVGPRERALSKEVMNLHKELVMGTGMTSDDHDLITPAVDNSAELSWHFAGAVPCSYIERIALLEAEDVETRLRLLIDFLATALAQQRLQAEIGSKLQSAMDASQREYHLREQLKALRTELGDSVPGEAEADSFETRIRESGMPEEVAKEALREAARLRRIQSDSAEYNIARTWLETLCEMPWGTSTPDHGDLAQAKTILDEDHYGLDKVKDRILEYLAVRQLRADSNGAILCFVGAPGVGKTSLGRSIARAMGRKFGRISLGGIKDENEIRGHRRTYVGALPGRIVRAIGRAGTSNPVIVLDELDKVGNDFRGDPASALLEVLDPEQNHAFVDHYLDVPIDLSQVLFIATANLLDPIPPALSDRFEIIEIPGYTEEEKLKIAHQFLLPRLAETHGLEPDKLELDDAALSEVVRDYTREAGLREFNRQLASLHRKVARMVVEGREDEIGVQSGALQPWLGPPKYVTELDDRDQTPGVVIGLAWTETGGDILFIEAVRIEDKHGLKLTGSLGDVMKESAQAAMSWLRAHRGSIDAAKADFDALFHLHVPAGATPKDGPSAGVGMVCAIASLITGRSVRPRLAMTGEITLRGKVLPVGGIKEKMLAARRAGVQHVVMPRYNEKDLIDLPEEVRRDLTFHLVDSVEDVLAVALVPPVTG